MLPRMKYDRLALGIWLWYTYYSIKILSRLLSKIAVSRA